MIEHNSRQRNVERITLEETQQFIKARKAAKFSHSKVGELIGVSRQTMHNWESANMFQKTMPRDVFEVLMEHFSQHTAETTHGVVFIGKEERITNEEQDLVTRARSKANICLEDAAEIAGVSYQTIAQWEGSFDWEPNMPREIFDKLMAFYSAPECALNAQKAKRRAPNRFRVSDDERAEMAFARRVAGINQRQAAIYIGRHQSTLDNWEDPACANAPRDEYEALMAYYIDAIASKDRQASE